MSNADEALNTLRHIRSEFAAFCKERGAVSEADTRAKVIDRILKEVCCWPESEISRETRVDRGYIDYDLTVQKRRYVAVEAKREGVPFVFPHDVSHRSLKLSGTILTEKAIREAIVQVRGYCDDSGIRYATATNGYAWIVFRAIREDIPWREGSARIFPTLEYIIDNFTDFWNLLSYSAISAGSLDSEFGSSLRVDRELYRVIDRLFNANLPLQRNRLHAQLHPIIKAIFEDIADQDQLEILQSCYVHSQSLQIVARDLDCVITDTIPKFLRNEGTEPIQQGQSDAGRFGAAISDAVHATSGQLFLLLGGIGSGKTTFLKRYQRTVGKDLLENSTLWFYIDFLSPPVNPHDMERFVWKSILEQLRTRYKSPHLETRRNIKRVFADNISALHETALKGFRVGSDEYEKALSPYLERWQTELSDYVPRLLGLCKPKRDLCVVFFIDNVDQLSPTYQAQIFLLAQHLTRITGSITVVSLREESYYTASVQRTFTAYTNRKFHIASPRFRTVIGNRLRFAHHVLDGLPGTSEFGLPRGIPFDKQAISEFLMIVEYSIFERNRNIARFIEAICFGNMRLALQMFTTFLTSGATDVDKMLYIYRRDGAYYVAFHEFVKSIMLGERCYYKEAYSPIMNVFDCGSEKNSSHLTAIRMLRLLLSHRAESSPEGQGYVELAKAAALFEDIFDNREDFVRTMNRLVTRQLVETNTRSTDNIDGASHVRVTSAGWYYERYLIRSFPYLDLVLQDTPLNEKSLVATIRDSVYQVDNLSGKEEEKLARTQIRFSRVEKFLDYLQHEEDIEGKHFGLEKLDYAVTRRIVPDILAQYQCEKSFIERRLRENREKYAEEKLFDILDEEKDLLETEDGSEIEEK